MWSERFPTRNRATYRQHGVAVDHPEQIDFIERSFAGVSISLSQAKALAKQAGGKLNDVVLAISSGVVRRYLLERGALPCEIK